MNEKIVIGLIEEIFNDYRRVKSSIESEHEALNKIKSILDAYKKDAAPLQRVD